ncbi:MAG TPA: hypothetical protein VEJ44_02010 [Acidimicrobiales bacterium]|nr:hypothetical protein [Acidimicrobiales bacterium]
MDDLERDIGARLRHAGEQVAPGTDLPARIRARVEHRQRRRRILVSSVPTACLLVAALTYVLVAGPGRSSRGHSTSSAAAAPSTTASPARPGGTVLGPELGGRSTSAAGSMAPSVGEPANSAAMGPTSDWVPVTWGDAQVDVPPDSVVSPTGCPAPSAPVTVRLGAGPAPTVVNCLLERSAGQTTVGLSTLAGSTPHIDLVRTTVNGITVLEGPVDQNPAVPTVEALVPSLGVEVDAEGPLAGAVIGTLVRSPRVVVLARGRAPQVPAPWKGIEFGGLHASTPAGWPVRRVAEWGSPCAVVMPWDLAAMVGAGAQPSVTLDSGKAPPAYGCPNLTLRDQQVSAPHDELIIDPGPSGPLGDGTSDGHCFSINRLRMCPVQAYLSSELVLSVHIPHGGTVAVVIGLSGNGQTARTILHSLRPA